VGTLYRPRIGAQGLAWSGLVPARKLRRLREIIQRDMDETGPYSFRIERLGIRVFDNIATTHLIFHCAGKTHEGADFDESYRWTHTWIHDDSESTLLAGVSYQVENA